MDDLLPYILCSNATEGHYRMLAEKHLPMFLSQLTVLAI